MRTPLFTLHLSIPFTSHSSEFVFTWAQPIAAAAIAFMSFINYLGVRLAGRLQVVLTALKIGAILAVVILGFVLAGKRPPSEHPLFPPSFNVSLLTGFLTAMVGALWAYDGWMDLTFAGSEIIDPHKNIPRALVGGTMTVGVIYLLANAVYFRVLPMEAVASAQNVASETVRVFAGARAAAWITAAMVLSAFTTLNSSVLTGSRVPFAMARDGLFFRITEGIHPRYRTPAGAIIFQAVISCLMVLTGQFEDLFSLFIFAQWIFYGLSVASVYGSRRKEPDLPRPYRAWGYPVVPAIFVLGAFALTVNLFIQRPIRSSIGLLLILAGLPFYYHWTKIGETTKGTMWSFEGRIGRRTFWTTFVSLFLGSLLVRLLLVALSSGGSEMQPWLVLIYVPALVVLTWVGLAMQVKRWHDLGYSGWMALINFTIIAIPIVLIILGCVKGTEGPNKYGMAQTEKRREFSP